MKTLVTIILSLIVAVPLFSFAVEGIVQYGSVQIEGYNLIVKFYDHDEDVLCYVADNGYRSNSISCVKD